MWKTRWVLGIILTLLISIQIQSIILAHGNEDHGEEKKGRVGDGAQNVRQIIKTVQSTQGLVKLTIGQKPFIPRAGEEVQFEIKAVELVEGGLAGGELPLTDARVTASIRQIPNTVVATKIDVHNEEEPAVYGIHYTFKSGGEFILTVALTTNDNRIFTDEFPITIQSKPINYVVLSVQGLIGLIALILIARNFKTARSTHATLISQVTTTALPNVIIIIIAGVIIYAVGRFMPSFEQRESSPVQTAATDTSNVLEVSKEAQIKFKITTEPAKQESIAQTLLVNGKVVVRPQFQADVTPPVAGKVLVSPQQYTVGDEVKKGTLLAVIEQTLTTQDAASLELNRLQIQNDRTRLESEVRQAKQKLNQLTINSQRAERLYAIQAIPLKELQQAQLEKQLAEDDLKRTTEQLIGYKNTSVTLPTGRFEVQSPVTGIIVATSLTPGEYVEPSKVLFKVMDVSRMWIEAQIYEKDLSIVLGSNMASFTVESYPNETFQIDGKINGRLVTVGSVVDSQTRTIPVIYEVNNSLGKLKDGMFARILIASTHAAEAITVPKSAVYDDAGRKFIFIFLGGEKFEQRDVDTGIETAERVEVRTTLKTDERVVVNGIRQLRNVALQGGK